LKRSFTALFFACLLLLASCGKHEEPVETDWSELQMALAVWDSQPALDYLTLLYGEENFNDYLADSYGIDPDGVTGGAVLYAGGVNAQEIAVLHLAENADPDAALNALKDYEHARAGAFKGYAPEQYDILEKAAAAQRGRYIALLIVPDQDAARDALDACFLSPPPQDPAASKPSSVPVTTVPQPQTKSEPAPVWSYDESRIINAWNSGDRNDLPQEDLEILSVLDRIPALTDPDLSDYQRELALHDWMLEWGEYDPGALSSGPVGEPIPHNDNPYGFLVGKKGICLGYATTFQLLMDLCGIECQLVPGKAHAGTEDHAWNLVMLDEEWYAVDVTWDDPIISIPVPDWMAHAYFNVTSDFLRNNDHRWDASAFPEAMGSAFAWAG